MSSSPLRAGVERGKIVLLFAEADGKRRAARHTCEP